MSLTGDDLLDLEEEEEQQEEEASQAVVVRASTPKKAASAKASPSKKGMSFKGSPGSASGNYIVNPNTGNVIQVRTLDRKSGKMKYNAIYAELVNSLGQEKVNAIKRYTKKEDADAVAKKLREERKAAGVGRSGESKATVYYFNKVTHHVGKKPKAGESHSEAFATKLEAQNWGYTHGSDGKGGVVQLSADQLGSGFLKKKPVQNPKAKLGKGEGDENILYTLEVVPVNGRPTNVFTQWQNKKGEPTASQRSYRAGMLANGGSKLPKLYTVKERLAMSEAKSESAKAARSSTKTDADVATAAAEARRRPGVKAESIKKILDAPSTGPKKRTAGQKVASLNLLGRGGAGGAGVYATKRKVVNRVSTKEAGARANRMWDGNGNVKPRAREFVTWYQQVSGAKGKDAGAMSDAEVIAALNQAFASGWLSKTERAE